MTDDESKPESKIQTSMREQTQKLVDDLTPRERDIFLKRLDAIPRLSETDRQLAGWCYDLGLAVARSPKKIVDQLTPQERDVLDRRMSSTDFGTSDAKSRQWKTTPPQLQRPDVLVVLGSAGALLSRIDGEIHRGLASEDTKELRTTVSDLVDLIGDLAQEAEEVSQEMMRQFVEYKHRRNEQFAVHDRASHLIDALERHLNDGDTGNTGGVALMAELQAYRATMPTQAPAEPRKAGWVHSHEENYFSIGEIYDTEADALVAGAEDHDNLEFFYTALAIPVDERQLATSGSWGPMIVEQIDNDTNISPGSEGDSIDATQEQIDELEGLVAVIVEQWFLRHKLRPGWYTMSHVKRREFAEVTVTNGHMGNTDQWCFYFSEYPEDGSHGPFESQAAAESAVEQYTRDTGTAYSITIVEKTVPSLATPEAGDA